MTTTKEDQMRAEFEIAHAQVCADFSRVPNGMYLYSHVEIRWEAWKACAESYEKKLAEMDAIINEELEKAGNDLRDATDTLIKLSEANVRNARLVEALTEISCPTQSDKLLWWQTLAREAISANSEAVAAWEAEKMEPYSTTSDKYRAELYDEVWNKAKKLGYGNVTDALVSIESLRREVAMLRDELSNCSEQIGWHEFPNTLRRVAIALGDTQATAEAYEREVAAKAIKSAASEFSCEENHETTHGMVERKLLRMAEELHATKERKLYERD